MRMENKYSQGRQSQRDMGKYSLYRLLASWVDRKSKFTT